MVVTISEQDRTPCFDTYPLSIILTSNVLNILLYGLGLCIVSRLGSLEPVLFLIYLLWLEIRLLNSSCRKCYYYGKLCAFGKGKLCALFFKKSDGKKFIDKEISWKSLIPDLLVFLIPCIIGIMVLIQDFNWPVVVALVTLFFLAFMGTGFVRSSLACPHCKQRQLGCPAEKLFKE